MKDALLENNIEHRFQGHHPTELRKVWICFILICVDRFHLPTLGGKAYFLLVVDDHSRYMWIELLRSKDEVLAYLKKIKARAETELEGKLKAVRTDRGGEFNSSQFIVFCTEFGIKHYTTTPYTPQ